MRTGTGTGNTDLTFLTTDHLGSTSATYRADNGATSPMRYMPWGEPRCASAAPGGSLTTGYTYTGQYSNVADFGLLYYNARWYDPSLGRFAQADSIIPNPGNPLDYDRYAYVRNNALKYTDPSGHWPSNHAKISGDFYTYSIDVMLWRYAVRIKKQGSVKFEDHEKLAIFGAVVAVGEKMGGAAGFRDVYGISGEKPMHILKGLYGASSSECQSITDGGCTSSSTQINFLTFSRGSEKDYLAMRNNVVHELGHAFKAAMYNRTGINVYDELGDWRIFHPGYPDRLAFTGPRGVRGPNYGFASRQNEFTWQQSLSGTDNEEFADQFLGWTFGMWESDEMGFTEDGQARAFMMQSKMPLWIDMVKGR